MNTTNLDELRTQAEQTEREYQQSIAARRVAVARSSQALAVCG
jgi:hypothetical protein